VIGGEEAANEEGFRDASRLDAEAIFRGRLTVDFLGEVVADAEEFNVAHFLNWEAKWRSSRFDFLRVGSVVCFTMAIGTAVRYRRLTTSTRRQDWPWGST